MKPKKPSAKSRPDYAAMADTLLQVAHDLRQQSKAPNDRDSEQAQRLERIAVEIQAGSKLTETK